MSKREYEVVRDHACSTVSYMPNGSTPQLAHAYYRQSKNWNVNSKEKVQIMPYKNPENKRRWEKEHRAQRNAQRRARRLGIMTRPHALSPKPDLVPAEAAKNGWKILLGLAIGFAGALVGALSGVRLDKAS